MYKMVINRYKMYRTCISLINKRLSKNSLTFSHTHYLCCIKNFTYACAINIHRKKRQNHSQTAYSRLQRSITNGLITRQSQHSALQIFSWTGRAYSVIQLVSVFVHETAPFWNYAVLHHLHVGRVVVYAFVHLSCNITWLAVVCLESELLYYWQ